MTSPEPFSVLLESTNACVMPAMALAFELRMVILDASEM